MNIHVIFNPKKFMAGYKKLNYVVFPLMVVCFAWGLYEALVASPPDYQQGEAVRMMYVHVPAAWMAMMLYTIMAGCGAAGIIWKNPLSYYLAYACALPGALFTLLCLITGSLWGKPIWGTWWIWDARLTSVLVLLFFYVGAMTLYRSIDDEEQAGKMMAILTLVGVVNIPIIKFSVEWWNTLHQPASILRSGGLAIDGQMLTPLFLMFGAYFCYALVVIYMRTATMLNAQKYDRLQQKWS